MQENIDKFETVEPRDPKLGSLLTVFAKLKPDANAEIRLDTNKLNGAQLAKLGLLVVKAVSTSALEKVQQAVPAPNSPAKDIEHAFIAMRDLSDRCINLIQGIRGDKGEGDT